MVSFAACASAPNDSLIPTYVAETAVARQAATAEVEQALADILTGTASVPTITPTITLTPTPTATVTPTSPPMATVIRDNAPVFAGPGFFFGSLTKLPFGDQIVILGISEDGLWLLIILSGGSEGWIALEHTEPAVKVGSLPTAEEPPREEFTITIKNSSNWDHQSFVFNISDLGLSYTIQPGSSKTIKIFAGYHHFSYGSQRASCQKSLYIVSNLFIEVDSSNNSCNVFP